MEEAAKIFLQQGVLGAVVIVLAVAYYRRDKDFIREKDSRIEDAKAVLVLHKQVLDAIQKLGELTELFEKREREREIADIAHKEYGPRRAPSRPEMETPIPVPPRRGPR